MANQHTNPLTDEHRKEFLDVLRDTANVRLAAETVGMSRRRFTDLKKRDQEFSDAWDEAKDCADDMLEHEARRRAFEGVEKPIMYQGVVVGKIREYSDRLLELLLIGARPEKYGRQRTEITGKDGKDLFAEHNKIDIARRLSHILTEGAKATGVMGTSERLNEQKAKDEERKEYIN